MSIIILAYSYAVCFDVRDLLLIINSCVFLVIEAFNVEAVLAQCFIK